MALALDLRCRVAVEAAPEWSILSGGVPADAGGFDLVRRTTEAVAPGSGPLLVEIESEIPLARGLGSSAALIVATAGAAREFARASIDGDELLRIAAAVEGHADNVAAALYGGMVAVGAMGEIRFLELHPSLEVLVAVPDATLSTEQARRVTSGPVETGVAARTSARIVSLLEGLRTGDPAALAGAAGDELHEARRAHLSPVTGRLMEAAAEAGALHSCWSGAGLSVLAFVTAEASEAVRNALAATLQGGYVLSPDIDQKGLIVG